MEIKTIGVVGTGKMGSGIGLTAALSGYRVILQDLTTELIVAARKTMEVSLDKLVAKNAITREIGAQALEQVEFTTNYEQYHTLDFVIESVSESLEIKKSIFERLETVCSKKAILVSNTSTFSITSIAAVTANPDRVAGMHFFLAPTKLVEITRGHYSSDATIAAAKAVAKKMNKVAIEVKKDSPGFIANRIYTPLFLEAFKVYEEGLASKEEIDLAMKSSYLPIGPFELADIIGLDVLLSGLEYYKEELGPCWNPPRSLKQMINAGRLGKKTGKGWYDYLT